MPRPAFPQPTRGLTPQFQPPIISGMSHTGMSHTGMSHTGEARPVPPSRATPPCAALRSQAAGTEASAYATPPLLRRTSRRALMRAA